MPSLCVTGFALNASSALCCAVGSANCASTVSRVRSVAGSPSSATSSFFSVSASGFAGTTAVPSADPSSVGQSVFTPIIRLLLSTSAKFIREISALLLTHSSDFQEYPCGVSIP